MGTIMFIIDIFLTTDEQKEENKNTSKPITRENPLTFYDHPSSSFSVFVFMHI